MTNMNVAKPGLGSVGSYQVSGTPFITSSVLLGNHEVHVAFPNVTQEFTIFTNQPNVYLTFLATGSDAGVLAGGHRVMIIPTGSSGQTVGIHNSPHTFRTKCKDIFIHKAGATNADVTVFAALTGIETGMMFHLTGSGISE